MGTSLSSALQLLPAASVVLCALLVAFLLARGDNTVEERHRRQGVAERPSVAVGSEGVRAAARRQLLPPGHTVPRRWLPYLIFGALPVWWALGLSFFQWPLIVLPFVYPLVRLGRRLRMPRRFGVWLAFIAWTLVSATQLHSGSRALAFVWRDSFYFAATVLFLFIYNSSERQLPTRRIVNGIAVFWICIVAGGWLGVLFPTVSLASPAEHVFPHSLLHNTYFYAHVHLQLAQVQHFLGFREGRPQALFAYTNAWGSTFAMTTPFAIGAISAARSLAWRRVLQVTLLAAIVPGVFSLDRGMWLSLGVGVVYAFFRLGARGDRKMALEIITLVGLAAVVIVVSPLGGLVSGRFSHKTGDTSRLARDVAAQAQVTANPIFGYGAPNQATQVTHTQKSVGTESEVFLLLYSHGVPGLFLAVVWLAYTVFRSGRIRAGDTRLNFWIHTALLVACVQAPYYELTERTPIMFTAAALLYRRIAQYEATPDRPRRRRAARPPRPVPSPAGAALR
ncbi:MAG: O-antigen ligase family protein [Gaiellales bacterium]